MTENKNLNCNFCGKSRDQVEKLIAGPNVYICNECISLSYNIIEKEEKDADNKLSEAMQENFNIEPIIETEENKGVGEEPWLFADGSFNPDWDASDLDMDTRYQFGSEANKYNRARMAYEKMKSQEKFNETAGKIFKFIKDNAILEEGEKYNDNK